MKVFVAIPVYDGKLPVQTVASLLVEQLLAGQNGHEIVVAFLPSCSVPALGRNQLVQQFLESECERLVFLDSDISFPPGSLLKIAHQPVDFVGGCYRFKLKEESYPIGWLPKKELWCNKAGLIEVETLPTGFLSLSRNVFETLKAAHPERNYEHFGQKAFCFFQMIFKDGHMHSEDTYFCKEWRQAGGKVFLDPEIALTHWDGNFPYEGHIGNWLKNREESTCEKSPE